MRERPDRTTYEIIKYNFRTAVRVGVYPDLVRGLANAQRLVEELDGKLTQAEKDGGISWFLQKRSRPR